MTSDTGLLCLGGCLHGTLEPYRRCQVLEAVAPDPVKISWKEVPRSSPFPIEVYEVRNIEKKTYWVLSTLSLEDCLSLLEKKDSDGLEGV